MNSDRLRDATRTLRGCGPSLLGAAAALAGLAWVSLYGFGWNDYATEAQPAVQALVAGHVGAFLALAPAYGGSLLLRAPFAFAPSLWGGGQLAVYRMLALPCLLAAGALAVFMAARLRAAGHTRLARATTMGLLTANPIAMQALQLGHPEELLAAVLCVSALLGARSGRPLWTAVLLGLAVGTKSWALVAVAPVAVTLPVGRVRMLALAGAIAGALVAPFLIAAHLNASAGSALGTPSGVIFQPWQIWWWLGSHGALVHGTFGEPKPGYRTPPGWISTVAHPLIVAITLPLTALWWRVRGRVGGSAGADSLGLLALLLLLRCILDPWDNIYYALPFLICLTVWETLTLRRPPAAALLASVATWILFQTLPGELSPDAQSAAYLAVALPGAALLALRVYAPGSVTRLVDRHLRPQPIRPQPVS